MQDQKKVWDNIAEEWDQFKKRQDPQVKEFVEKAKGKFIDLGCGSGRNFAKTKAEIYSVDFSGNMLKYAKRNAKKLSIKAEFFELDITKQLPFEDNFFDSGISVATLHCINGKKHRENILKEIFRVLKPKAKFMLKVWNRKSSRFKGKEEKLIKWRDKGERYYYIYEEKELEEELKKAGFKIVLIVSTKEENFQLQEISVIVEK
ncbi:Ubiquinone/menaquinone biosynthesis C-methyltransferase UbiE [uncultured archaeon]|nr:Ubiquinone/menaquinone biosynthesis C-methyltransferase UbiE [uncultured archaeon]